MAQDPRKRQKKLQKKTAKRKEKKHIAVRQSSLGIADRLVAVQAAPILHSRVSDAVWDSGIGYVLLSRLLPNGSVAVAVFLLDRYCLGVKDAFGEIVGRGEYDERFIRRMGQQTRWEDEAPEFCRKLVEGGVAFAREYGLPPHEDYHKAKVLFGDIDASKCADDIEYGIDGKPFFMRGPYDDEARCRQILSILAQKLQPAEIAAMLRSDRHAPGGTVFEDNLLGPGGDDDLDDEELDEEEDGSR